MPFSRVFGLCEGLPVVLRSFYEGEIMGIPRNGAAPTVFFTLFFASLLAIQGCKTANDDSGWTRSEKNPVLKPGRKDGGSSNDYYNLSDCCVLKDGAVYRAWYTSSGPTAYWSTNHCNISLAESADGIEWTKYPGNPVLDIDSASWDAYAVETVSVIIDPAAAPEKKYQLWYAGKTSDVAGNPAYDIGYAYSPDGVSWTKHGAPVLTRGASAEWDNHFIEGPTVLLEGGTYYLWYAGMDAVANGQASDGKVNIGLATSNDGIIWSKNPANPVLATGRSGSWDSRTVQDPHVLKFGGRFHMWYGGKTTDYKNYGQQTGYAVSDDGITWTKSAANPTFRRGDPGQWDDVTASFGSTLIEDGRIRLWYTGMDKDYNPDLPEFWEIGYAEKLLKDGSIDE
jgi:hypothetical protein